MLEESQKSWQEFPLKSIWKFYESKGMSRKEAMKEVAKDRGVSKKRNLSGSALEPALKIISAICTPYFAGLFSEFGCYSPLQCPHPGTNFPQTVAHILQKAFSKHAPEEKK